MLLFFFGGILEMPFSEKLIEQPVPVSWFLPWKCISVSFSLLFIVFQRRRARLHAFFHPFLLLLFCEDTEHRKLGQFWIIFIISCFFSYEGWLLLDSDYGFVILITSVVFLVTSCWVVSTDRASSKIWDALYQQPRIPMVTEADLQI